MRTMRLLLILGFLCGCAPTARTGAGADDGLTVLVYNIHAGKDAKGVHNLERVADVVKETGADLVLLQEVDRFTTRSGNEDQIGRLSELSGMHGAFGKTLDYQGGQYGIAILSRWPIARDTLYHLPIDPPQPRAGGSYEPRGALYAAIVAPDDTLHVFNTHLDASGNDTYRRQEARELLALAAPFLERSAPVMVGGDLNSLPESAVITFLTDGELRDPWPSCGQGDGYTYPDSLPVRRIDYLLMPDEIACRSARVLSPGPSDHRGVVFRLRVGR